MAQHHRANTCSICHSSAIDLDEVWHGSAVLLARCEHCDHRWTLRAPASVAPGSLAVPLRAALHSLPQDDASHRGTAHAA